MNEPVAETQYQYSYLRYTHNASTGEFVNVGVAFFDMRYYLVVCRIHYAVSHVGRIFPPKDREAIRNSLDDIEAKLEKSMAKINNIFVLAPDLEHRLPYLLGAEDVKFSWSGVKRGLTDSPSLRLEQLFKTMTGKS